MISFSSTTFVVEPVTFIVEWPRPKASPFDVWQIHFFPMMFRALSDILEAAIILGRRGFPGPLAGTARSARFGCSTGGVQ